MKYYRIVAECEFRDRDGSMGRFTAKKLISSEKNALVVGEKILIERGTKFFSGEVISVEEISEKEFKSRTKQRRFIGRYFGRRS